MKSLIYRCSFFSLVLFLVSCSNDYLLSPEQGKEDNTLSRLTNNFYQVTSNTPPEIQRSVLDIQYRTWNNSNDNEFFQKFGQPIWEKGKIIRKTNYENYIIPVKARNKDSVSCLLVVTNNRSGFNYRLITRSQISSYNNLSASQIPNSEEVYQIFCAFEKILFAKDTFLSWYGTQPSSPNGRYNNEYYVLFQFETCITGYSYVSTDPTNGQHWSYCYSTGTSWVPVTDLNFNYYTNVFPKPSNYDPPLVGGGSGNGVPGNTGIMGNSVSKSYAQSKLAEITNTSTLNSEQYNKLVEAMRQYLASCLNRYLLNYLNQKGVKFNWGMNPNQLSAGSYNPSNNTISFKETSDIKIQILQEEVFHGYQNQFYSGGISPYLLPPYYGRSNIEFEDRFYSDLLVVVQGLEGIVFDLDYHDWLFSITNFGENLPPDINSLLTE